MPSTSDGSTPDTPDATPRLSRSVTRLKTACQPASDALSSLLAFLPPVDERRSLFAEAGIYQQEQMALFLRQQTTPEDVSL